jgi:ABC-2 type transport system permease protein
MTLTEQRSTPRDASDESSRRGGVSVFLALLARDLRDLRKKPTRFLLRTILQPLLFIFVFSYVLPTIAQGPSNASAALSGQGGRGFTIVLGPGLIAVAMVYQGIQAVTVPLTTELNFTGELEDRLLAPVPLAAVCWSKLAGGAIQSIFAGALVIPIMLFVHAIGQSPQFDANRWWLVAVVVIATALLSSCMGMVLGTAVNPRRITVLMSFIMIPLTFLGCVYYPWAALQPIPWLKILVLFNPLLYFSEALRSTLVPQLAHLPTWGLVVAFTVGIAVLTPLAIRLFVRRCVT